MGEFPDLPTPADTSVGRVSPLFDLEVPSIVLVGLRSVILRRGLPTPRSQADTEHPVYPDTPTSCVMAVVLECL